MVREIILIVVLYTLANGHNCFERFGVSMDTFTDEGVCRDTKMSETIVTIS